MDRHLLVILALFLLSSCSKDEDTDGSGSILPSPLSTTISGITQVDVNGNLFGTVDLSDWGTTDLFPVSVLAHFNFPDTLDYSGADTSTIEIIGFPNPCQDFIQLYLNSSNTTVMKFALVDTAQNLLGHGGLNVISGNQIFVVSLPDSIAPNQCLYRIYYQFYTQSGIVYSRGHGDLQKQ